MGGPLTKDCALFGAGKSKHEEGYCLRSLFFVIVRQCIKGASLKPGHLPHTGSFERRSLVKRAVKNRMEFALVFPRCELLPERFYRLYTSHGKILVAFSRVTEDPVFLILLNTLLAEPVNWHAGVRSSKDCARAGRLAPAASANTVKDARTWTILRILMKNRLYCQLSDNDRRGQ